MYVYIFYYFIGKFMLDIINIIFVVICIIGIEFLIMIIVYLEFLFEL